MTRSKIQEILDIEKTADTIVKRLRVGKIIEAIELARTMTAPYDFTSIAGDFETNLKSEFLNVLNIGFVPRALDIRNVLGKGIDFSDQIKDAYYFCRLNGLGSQIQNMKKAFPEIDFDML